MLAEYKTRTNIGVGLGLVGQLLGRVMIDHGNGLGIPVLLVAATLFIWGCAQYAIGKGHSGWFGALGMLSLIGLLVLFFLPDRNKTA